MGDVVKEFINGQTPARKHPEFWGGDIPWVSSGELNYNIITNTNEKITETGRQSANLQILPKGTLLIAITGLEAAGTRGSCGILGINATTNQSCMALIPDTEKVTKDFLYNWYLKIGEEYGIKYTQGTKQQSYNIELLKKLPIRLPKMIDEQNSLTNFLTCIDQKISFMEKKYTILENYYKSLIHQTYAFNQNKPKITFSNMNWEEISLNDILDEINIKSTENNQYPLLSSTANGIFLQDEYFDRNVGSKDNTGYKIISKNEIVFSPQNLWMGNINVNDKFEKGIVSPSYKIFKTNKKVKIGFLKHLLKTERMIYEYKLSSEQGASIVRRNLNMNLFLDIKIKIPSIEEQEKIARLMEYIMSHRDKIKKEINIAKEFKKTMLSKMFC